MNLSLENINKRQEWEAIEVKVPQFDIKKIIENTKSNPKWIHFGAGNIFRGFIANAAQKLLNEGLMDSGIIAVDSFDYEVINKIYKPYDNLSILVLMSSSGEFDKTIIGSVTESIAADYNDENSIKRLKEIFINKELQMVSFTITEKGYGLTNPNGEYFPVVIEDIKKGPENPKHTMAIVAGLLYERFKNGANPVTLVSMDNCSHNGDKLKKGIVTIAKEWNKSGFVSDEFIDYVSNPSKVAYPLTMIDKITPRPSKEVQKVLKESGINGMEPIITSKNSYMAAFVNAEISEYLVIEDKFTNGRPPLEKAGVIFTDRKTVNQVETMKVTTCLNPLHTALAVSGCLLGYESISETVKDHTLLNLIKTIGYNEGLKVVVNPGIIDPKAFIDEVVNERFTNPYIPDTPQRIATDTSQKVGIRFGETIKSYNKDENLNPESLTAIPMAIALWIRYLMGVNDKGEEMELSPDPLLEDLRKELKDIKLGDKEEGKLKNILSNKNIFGQNLYEVGLGNKIENMFNQLNEGKGAVKKTLLKYFG